MQVRPIIALSLWTTLLGLAACSKPPAPDPSRPPEPQASGRSAAVRAVQEPLDRAKAVEEASREAAKSQRQAIEAAGG